MNAYSSQYTRQLSDPRWQRKRLEIMQAADWKCVRCDCDDMELHVHHAEYHDDKKPWEYEDKFLLCLCSDCHTLAHLPDFKIIRAYPSNNASLRTLSEIV